MARFFKKRNISFGKAPGSITFIGEKKIDHSELRLTTYNKDEINENRNIEPDKIEESIEQDKVNWFNIFGLHEEDVLEKIGKAFNLPSLLMEDVANTAQRAKIEWTDDIVFIALKIPAYSVEKQKVLSEQFSMIIKDNYLVTFHEDFKDVFKPVKIRLRNNIGTIRSRGADYLAYTLFDTIAENYANIIEQLGVEIDNLEGDLVSNPDQNIVYKINHYKQELNFAAKILLPVKDILFKMTKQVDGIVSNDILPFYNDLNDLVIHTIESIDSYRVILTDYIEVYNSVQNFKLNDIVRVLTIFSAIFIPMTFLAGIYGTNFEYLPELKFKWSYPIFWMVMIFIAFFMIWFFRRKKWL